MASSLYMHGRFSGSGDEVRNGLPWRVRGGETVHGRLGLHHGFWKAPPAVGNRGPTHLLGTRYGDEGVKRLPYVWGTRNMCGHVYERY